MEPLLASSDYHLLPMADYKLGNTASYVGSRKEAAFFSSVQSASTDGLRVMTCNVHSVAFIDANNIHFTWAVTNTNTTQSMQPLTCGAHCLIQRMMVNIGRNTVEDLYYYGWPAEMMELVLPYEKRLSKADLGFGAHSAPANGDWVANEIGYTAADKHRRLVYKPTLSGLLQGQIKWAPGMVLGQQGPQIQLELANASYFVAGPANPDASGAMSQSYTITDARACANTITVTSELMPSYSQHLLSSKLLMLSFRSSHHVMHPLAAASSWGMQVARTFTRLNTVFVSLLNGESNTKRAVNTFYNNTHAAGDTVANYLSIGDRLFSTFDREGTSQHMQRLYEALGTAQSFQGSSITRGKYEANQANFRRGLEKVSQTIRSGFKLSHGQLLTVHMGGVGDDLTTGSYAQRAYAALHYECILGLQSTGATVHS